MQRYLNNQTISLLTCVVLASCGKNTQFGSSAVSDSKKHIESIPSNKEADSKVAQTEPITPKPDDQQPSAPDITIEKQVLSSLPELGTRQAPTAILNGQPSGDSSVDQVEILVSGDGVVNYDFVLTSTVQPCESLVGIQTQNVNQPIVTSLSALSEGPIKVCVWGRNSQGDKQHIATEASWNKKLQSCGAASNGASETRFVYQNSAVSFGQSCIPASQTRTCQNGTWSAWMGSSFSQTSCVVAAAANCGATPHGSTESRTVFERSQVPFGNSCQSGTQTRMCQNGVFGAWSGSNFVHSSCVVQNALSCGLTPHNGSESRTVYQTATVPFGSTCVSGVQTRTCSNGILSNWTGSAYSESTCSVNPPASCGAVAHNGTENRTVYQSANVPYGSSCVSAMQTRTCTNGTFGAWSGSNYTSTNCTVAAPASCGSISHNGAETRTVYQSSTVPYGSNCVSGQQTRTCNNGAFTSWQGSSFSSLSCSPLSNTAPTLNSIAPQSVVRRLFAGTLKFDLQLVGSDVDSNLSGYRVVSASQTLPWTLSSEGLFSINVSDLPYGPATLTISFQSYDSAGATSSTRTLTLNILSDRETVEVVPGSEVNVLKNGSGQANCPTNKFGIGIRGQFTHADTLVCATLRTKTTQTPLTWGPTLSTYAMSNAGSTISCVSGFSINGTITSISGENSVIRQIGCRGVQASGFPTSTGGPNELSVPGFMTPAVCASNYAPALYGVGSPVTADWHFDKGWCVEWIMLR